MKKGDSISKGWYQEEHTDAPVNDTGTNQMEEY